MSKHEMTVAEQIRAILEAGCKAFNKVSDEQAKLNEKRAGSYTSLVQAGDLAGTSEAFTAAYDALKADVAGNVGNIGKRLGCKLGKPDKDGNAKYTIPSGMMTAASTVAAALRYGISLRDSDGNLRSYREILRAKSEADAEANKSKETDLQRMQRTVRELAAKIAEGAAALTLTEATEVCKILAAVAATERGEKHAKTGTNG